MSNINKILIGIFVIVIWGASVTYLFNTFKDYDFNPPASEYDAYQKVASVSSGCFAKFKHGIHKGTEVEIIDRSKGIGMAGLGARFYTSPDRWYYREAFTDLECR